MNVDADVAAYNIPGFGRATLVRMIGPNTAEVVRADGSTIYVKYDELKGLRENEPA